MVAKTFRCCGVDRPLGPRLEVGNGSLAAYLPAEPGAAELSSRLTVLAR